jgi:hypothetical protein
MVPLGLSAYFNAAARRCPPQKVQINTSQEHHALVCFKTRRKTMTSKLKLMLIATIAAVSIASPALAQTANTHQERSGQFEQAPYAADGGSGYVGPSSE